MTLTAIDLFAGMGGFTAGAEAAGAKVLWAANHWPLAVEVHYYNHPEVQHVVQDLHQADWSKVPPMDLVLGAPACQGHSQAASRGGTGKRGTAPRSDAYRSTAWAVVSCVEVHRPPFVLVENVKQFALWELYPVWRIALEKLGYALSETLVQAADLGAPQERERLFVAGVLAKKPFQFKIKKKKRVGFKTCISSKAGNWQPVSSKPSTVRQRVAKGRRNHPKGMFVTQHVTGHPGRPLSRPIGTITTKHQWGLVRKGKRGGDEMRMLTVDEYRCAMAFPDTYFIPDKVVDGVKLLGNAVCPPVAKELVRQIIRRG